jgi:DNA mismatch endonuclease (patch repair protein)
MAAVRSRGNKSTERTVRAMLMRAGLKGWRVCAPEIEGKPDFAFEVEHLAIFVDGCHWHGCPQCYRAPATNTAYWSGKLARNRKRDKIVSRKLRHSGWRVMRFWEHEVRDCPGKVISRIVRVFEATTRREK